MTLTNSVPPTDQTDQTDQTTDQTTETPPKKTPQKPPGKPPGKTTAWPAEEFAVHDLPKPETDPVVAQAVEESADDLAFTANLLKSLGEEVEQIAEWGTNRQYVLRAFISQMSSENALRWNELSRELQQDVEKGILKRMQDREFIRPWVKFLKAAPHEPVVRRKFLFITLMAGTDAFMELCQAVTQQEYEQAKAALRPPEVDIGHNILVTDPHRE